MICWQRYEIILKYERVYKLFCTFTPKYCVIEPKTEATIEYQYAFLKHSYKLILNVKS